jgi:hypothetical protein
MGDLGRPAVRDFSIPTLNPGVENAGLLSFVPPGQVPLSLGQREIGRSVPFGAPV